MERDGMGWVSMGWDRMIGTGRDEMGWVGRVGRIGMEWHGIGMGLAWDGMGWDGMRCDRRIWYRMGLDGTIWGGIIWDGMGRDGMECEEMLWYGMGRDGMED